MSSTYHQRLTLSLFGQSHGPAIGIVLDGFPAGFPINFDEIHQEMERRAPGRDPFSTGRCEADKPEILSGVWQGHTTGQPLCILIRNTDSHAETDPEELDQPRPSHADWPAHIHFNGQEDFRGGGHASGRLTAPLVFAGALCKQYLRGKGIGFDTHILRLGTITDDSFLPFSNEEDLSRLKSMRFPVLRKDLEAEMEKQVLHAKAEGDSTGGVAECRITGLSAGLGEPFFDSIESTLSRLMFSIPAVKGVSFGEGFSFAGMTGSESNDPYHLKNGVVRPLSNHAGGVLGGYTTGMPIVFQCCVRATPSIYQEQETVSLLRGTEEKLKLKNRNDPCILPRVIPVIEAMAAIGVMAWV